MNEPADICIIGGGPSGLACARALADASVPFVVYEASDDIGGIWYTQRPTTPIYRTTHLISSTKMSAFAGFPFERRYPDYPGHELVLSYIQAFAENNDLGSRVQTGRRVVDVVPAGPRWWDVRLDDGERRRFAGVVVGCGHNWYPNMPSFPGRFEGTTLHSLDYWSNESLHDKRVLIVGGGNSGCDIACDAAPVAATTSLSLRRGYHFFPKHIAGIPSDQFMARVNAQGRQSSPHEVERMVRDIVGDFRRYGLPRPDHRPFESNPIMNTLVLHHITHGDIAVKPDVARLLPGGVAYVDGTEDELDALVLATGYRYRLSVADDLVRGPDGELDLHLNVCARQHDGLFVMGLFETDGAAFPLISLQAELVASLVASGQSSVKWWPDEDKVDLSGGRAYVASERHRISVHRDVYAKALEEAIEVVAER